MSTRGAVAVGTAEKWSGVYNHFDSYFGGLGEEVWEHVQKNKDRLADFAKDILSFDDWRAYLDGGICQYCGKKTGQPHTINGQIMEAKRYREKPMFKGCDPLTEEGIRKKYQMFAPAMPDPNSAAMKAISTVHPDISELIAKEAAAREARIQEEIQIAENVKRCGFPDPEAKYHQHNDGDPKDYHIKSDNSDPLFIEYVYVIDFENRKLHVLVNQSYEDETGKKYEPDPKIKKENLSRADLPILRQDGFRDYGHCAYRHMLLKTLDIDKDSFDSEALNKLQSPEEE